MIRRTGHLVAARHIKEALLARGYGLRKGLSACVREFQRFHGLPVTGYVGNRTWRALCAPRVCGMPDAIIVDGRVQWPKVDGEFKVTWGFYGSTLPGISAAEFKEAIRWGFEQWALLCGIVPTYKSNGANANVRVTAANLGGAQGVLADSELPYGSQVRQRYDVSERWVLSESPGPAEIDLLRVAAHELGHALGLEHSRTGGLMAPIYDVRIQKPTGAWEIAEVKKRYGPRAEPAPPPAPPAPIPNKVWVKAGETLIVEAIA